MHATTLNYTKYFLFLWLTHNFFWPRWVNNLGRNDRPYRVPRRARGWLCPNGDARHQKGIKIPKQSATGEFDPPFINFSHSSCKSYRRCFLLLIFFLFFFLFYFIPSPVNPLSILICCLCGFCTGPAVYWRLTTVVPFVTVCFCGFSNWVLNVFFYCTYNCVWLVALSTLILSLCLCFDVLLIPSQISPFPIKKQGELIDRVEYHVASAADHVKSGQGELHQAQQYQSKARKVGLIRYPPPLPISLIRAVPIILFFGCRTHTKLFWMSRPWWSWWVQESQLKVFNCEAFIKSERNCKNERELYIP